MATDKQSAEKEITVEEKLSTLYQLQTMMTEIDKIKTLRGELPLEVQDLEDEIAGLEIKYSKLTMVPDSTLMIGDIIASGETLIHCLRYGKYSKIFFISG